MNTIALISCVSKKRDCRTQAENMYTSPLFIKSLAYVKIVLKPFKAYILSAKHGLLELDDEIDTYDETLNGKTKKHKIEWSNHVFQQLSIKCNTDTDKFIFLAGQNYYEHLIDKLPNHKILMKGLRIGEKLQWLNGELVKWGT
ncbi:MAG: hypothetical protein LBU76_05885 [Azoarcus sp.]|jgi:hypothetical protein|nr:hypothetical protein [Azoarcus sp.]